MSKSRNLRLCALMIITLIIQSVKPQQPFDLDTSFRTSINTWYVNSILPLDDGSILVSGQAHYPGDPVGSFRMLSKLLASGQLDSSFPEWTPGGGKLTQWEDGFYVGGHTIRRVLMNGSLDPQFIPMNLGLYFSSFQGGDYHIYPDGRVLMSGLHQLSDTIRGYTGDHCLIWFSNEGYLDTTKHHRKCAGSLDFFKELPDGKFIGSLGNPPNIASWDGVPTGSNIIRMHADGALDYTFQANVWWGYAYDFLPTEDGRVYAVGQFKVQGLPDTLQLVRFMPDGSLDPTFNNTINFRIAEMNTQPWGGLVRKINRLNADQLIVTGSFEEVEGQVRRCIAMVDANGYLDNEYFNDAGVGNFYYQGTYGSALNGVTLAPDGNYYTWGAYHGYNDGITNDSQQRFISRLHGTHVGLGEYGQEARPWLKIYPNPVQEQVTFEFKLQDTSELVVRDAQGRIVHSQQLKQSEERVVWDTRHVAQGVYMVLIHQGKDQQMSENLIIQR